MESVGWDKYGSTDKSTGKILVGTSRGLIYEALIEDKGRDRVFTKVYNLCEGDSKEDVPVSGLEIELFPGTQPGEKNTKYFVMAATPTRHYQFIGGPTFEAMFEKYDSAAFLELPGEMDYSVLQFYSPSIEVRAKTCAWLTGAGIYYGSLVFGSQSQPGDRVLEDGTLLAYPADLDTIGPPSPPLSMALTEFHVFLLYPDRLIAINQLSEEIVYDEPFMDDMYGLMRGLSVDPSRSTVWMYSDLNVFEIVLENEKTNVWRLYLNERKYDSALEYCSTVEQKEKVLSAQADHCFDVGSYNLAAETYAKTDRSFEEVALRFVNAGERDALQTYLLCKLDTLDPLAQTQQVMICTWLTEIFLDKLNSLMAAKDELLEQGTDTQLVNGSELDFDALYDETLDEFQEFLYHNHDVLNEHTTFELMSSHGRTQDLLYYAELIGNFEWLIGHHIQQKNYSEAIRLLASQKNPMKIEELYYRFAPVLVQFMPKETVDMLMMMPRLDAQKLIPALMRYESQKEVASAGSNHAIRYLEWCVENGSTDPSIHNYLASLYVREEDENLLLTYLTDQIHKPMYDRKYVLRLCHENGKMRACVNIYNDSGLYEEAVTYALDVDIGLAKEIVVDADVSKVERRRLWLLVEKYVITELNDIPQAMDILKECEVIHVEDILPYFPDFVRIGEFKDEICESLEDYNENVEGLKDEMEEYTRSANLIRKDILSLKNRSGFVTSNQKCDLCTQPVLTRHFYLFPCTHVFHADCIAGEIQKYIEKNPRVSIFFFFFFSFLFSYCPL